jgi:hypothetical protein
MHGMLCSGKCFIRTRGIVAVGALKLHVYVFEYDKPPKKQDRQCAYDVILRRVHATIVAVEKQHLLHILTTEEKARKNLSQGSRRVPAGTMKTEYTEQSIHKNKNT